MHNLATFAIIGPSITVLGYGSSLADPVEPSSIIAAVRWLEGTLLGTIATTVATIAVAGVGFLALSGRVSARRALTVVAGCFILFGASSIVAGIETAMRENDWAEVSPPSAAVNQPSPLLAKPQQPSNYDPYAGAAVPQR